ncbi:MAG TPA: hypothetical protein VNG11_01760, partial [Chloroflexota bacterium]|nr:hypothetical protein [Chloroflexota bacterium]
MSATALPRVERRSAFERFLKTPKGYFLALLGVITAVGLFDAGPSKAVPGLVAAMLAAGLADVIYLRVVKGTLIFPSGALL